MGVLNKLKKLTRQRRSLKNKATGGMTKTQMENDSVSGEFARFRETIETNLPYYVNDVESLKSENVNEYEFLSSQDVSSFLCVPYNRRE